MEKNIFEAATNEFNKSSKKGPEKVQAPPTKKTPESEFGNNDPETAMMIEQMSEMRLKLNEKLGDLYDLGKKHHLDVDQLLQTRSNLNPKELDQIFQQSALLETQMTGVIKSRGGIAKQKHPQSKETLEKERKGKTLGARKKNWISVR
jgi:hypothetical protein